MSSHTRQATCRDCTRDGICLRHCTNKGHTHAKMTAEQRSLNSLNEEKRLRAQQKFDILERVVASHDALKREAQTLQHVRKDFVVIKTFISQMAETSVVAITEYEKKLEAHTTLIKEMCKLHGLPYTVKKDVVKATAHSQATQSNLITSLKNTFLNAAGSATSSFTSAVPTRSTELTALMQRVGLPFPDDDVVTDGFVLTSSPPIHITKKSKSSRAQSKTTVSPYPVGSPPSSSSPLHHSSGSRLERERTQTRACAILRPSAPSAPSPPRPSAPSPPRAPSAPSPPRAPSAPSAPAKNGKDGKKAKKTVYVVEDDDEEDSEVLSEDEEIHSKQKPKENPLEKEKENEEENELPKPLVIHHFATTGTLDALYNHFNVMKAQPWSISSDSSSLVCFSSVPERTKLDDVRRLCCPEAKTGWTVLFMRLDDRFVSDDIVRRVNSFVFLRQKANCAIFFVIPQRKHFPEYELDTFMTKLPLIRHVGVLRFVISTQEFVTSDDATTTSLKWLQDSTGI